MKRYVYITAFILLLATEICIGLLAEPSGFIRCSMGDVLVIPTIYFLVRIFVNPVEKIFPALVFLFGCAVEILQYIDLCGILGIDKQSLMGILIGTTGSIADIACYFAGMVLIYVYLFAEQKIKLNKGGH